MLKLGRVKFLAVLLLVLGVLIALTPRYIFPVCEYKGMRIMTQGGGYVPMRCFYTGQAELGLGLLIVLLSAFLLLSTQRETQIYLSLSLAAAFSLSLLLPTVLIGICRSPTMPCRVGTWPALLLEGSVGIILSLLSLGLAWGKK